MIVVCPRRRFDEIAAPSGEAPFELQQQCAADPCASCSFGDIPVFDDTAPGKDSPWLDSDPTRDVTDDLAVLLGNQDDSALVGHQRRQVVGQYSLVVVVIDERDVGSVDDPVAVIDIQASVEAS